MEYRATDSHPGSEYRRSTDRCRYGSVVARLQASRNQEVGLNDLPPDDSGHPLATAFKLFLQQPAFPCVAAKAGLSRDQFTFVVARDLRSGWDDLRVYPALLAFVSRYRRNRARFSSFVVLFEGPATLSEAKFEHHLWARLQSLSDKDAWLGLPYDDRVESLPDDPHFSSVLAVRRFSWSVSTRPQVERRVASKLPLWSSTCMTSSSNFGRTVAMTFFANGLASVTCVTRDRQIPCWRPTVKFPKPVSTVAVWSRTDGCARYDQE